jgi:hypothetical protein
MSSTGEARETHELVIFRVHARCAGIVIRSYSSEYNSTQLNYHYFRYSISSTTSLSETVDAEVISRVHYRALRGFLVNAVSNTVCMYAHSIKRLVPVGVDSELLWQMILPVILVIIIFILPSMFHRSLFFSRTSSSAAQEVKETPYCILRVFQEHCQSECLNTP